MLSSPPPLSQIESIYLIASSWRQNQISVPPLNAHPYYADSHISDIRLWEGEGPAIIGESKYWPPSFIFRVFFLKNKTKTNKQPGCTLVSTKTMFKFGCWIPGNWRVWIILSCFHSCLLRSDSVLVIVISTRGTTVRRHTDLGLSTHQNSRELEFSSPLSLAEKIIF